MSDSVLVVSAVSPEPANNGRRTFLSGLVRYLVDRFGHSNVHYALAADESTPLPDLPGQYYRLPQPSTGAKLRALGAHSLGRGRLSLQESLLNSPELRTALAHLVDRLRPDIEFYDTLRLGQHRLPSRPMARQILHLDDLYSVRYERMLETGSGWIDPLGEFAHNVPAALRGLARRPHVYRRLLRWEARRLRARERTLVHEFEVSTLVSTAEVETLRSESNSSSIRVITPIVALPRRTDRMPADPPEFLFLGRLNVPHNSDAICWFLNSVFPRVLARRPDSHLCIVGGGAGGRLHELASRFPHNVTLAGYVTESELDDHFARATALVAPLRFGSGVKLKVLDALVRGVPVVGTAVALEGIACGVAPVPMEAGGDGVCAGFTLVPDIAGWPEILTRLSDPAVNAACSDAAAVDGRRLYGQQDVYDQYDRLFFPQGFTRRYAGDDAVPHRPAAISRSSTLTLADQVTPG